jgi:hypothetical protein
VYIGTAHGVLESRDGGDTWRALDDGLPRTPVRDLVFQPSERLLRAFTYGRGVWERKADIDPCASPPATPEVDLYLRDHRYDLGLRPTGADFLDPIQRLNAYETDDEGEPLPAKRTTLHWTDGADLKLDRAALAGETFINESGDEVEPDEGFQTPASTVDYAGGALDCIGFEALDHRDLRRGAKARVYLQAHNRGPDRATNVTARLYWAAPLAGGAWPDLPAGFWSTFPNADPPSSSKWQPVAAARTVAEIRPAEPEVLTWEWDVPDTLPDQLGLLAIISGAEDDVFEGQSPGTMPLTIESVVQQNKRVLLKAVKTVARPGSSSCVKWLKRAGVVAAVGLVALALYEGLD